MTLVGSGVGRGVGVGLGVGIGVGILGFLTGLGVGLGVGFFFASGTTVTNGAGLGDGDKLGAPKVGTTSNPDKIIERIIG